jgi:hypothetical protein
VLKILGRLAILAAIGAVIGYVFQRRKQDDVWDPEDPDGDWGMAQADLQRSSGSSA